MGRQIRVVGSAERIDSAEFTPDAVFVDFTADRGRNVEILTWLVSTAQLAGTPHKEALTLARKAISATRLPSQHGARIAGLSPLGLSALAIAEVCVMGHMAHVVVPEPPLVLSLRLELWPIAINALVDVDLLLFQARDPRQLRTLVPATAISLPSKLQSGDPSPRLLRVFGPSEQHARFVLELEARGVQVEGGPLNHILFGALPSHQILAIARNEDLDVIELRRA